MEICDISFLKALEKNVDEIKCNSLLDYIGKVAKHRDDFEVDRTEIAFSYVIKPF